jgi:hypothetical protein
VTLTLTTLPMTKITFLLLRLLTNTGVDAMVDFERSLVVNVSSQINQELSKNLLPVPHANRDVLVLVVFVLLFRRCRHFDSGDGSETTKNKNNKKNKKKQSNNSSMWKNQMMHDVKFLRLLLPVWLLQ